MNDRYNRFDRGSKPYRGGQPQRRPSTLPPGFSLFYLAIICPPHIDDYINECKNYMYHRYGCRSAQKSPAHLTLISPFKAEDEMLDPLQQFADNLLPQNWPIALQFNGYGQFDDRVLYAAMHDSPALESVAVQTKQLFEEAFPSIIRNARHGFHAHVTIATHDIPEGKLDAARAYFEANVPMNAAFEVSGVKLLRLQNGRWNVV